MLLFISFSGLLIFIRVRMSISSTSYYIRYSLTRVGAFVFTSFRSRDLMSCDSASANRVAEEVYLIL
jgi:hypothetical protein